MYVLPIEMHGTFRCLEKECIGPVAGDEMLIFASPYTSSADSLTAPTNGSLILVRDAASPCKNRTFRDLSSNPFSIRYLLSLSNWTRGSISGTSRKSIFTFADDGIMVFAPSPVYPEIIPAILHVGIETNASWTSVP